MTDHDIFAVSGVQVGQRCWVNASKELILRRDPLGHEKRRCEENTTACRAVERRVRDSEGLNVGKEFWPPNLWFTEAWQGK